MTTADRQALAELVAVKDLKARIAAYNPQFRWSEKQFAEFASMQKEYDERQPLAWAAARAALAAVQEPTGGVEAWTIIAPDGRRWTGASPVKAAAAAQRDTIDPVLAMQRINAMVDEENAIRDKELAEAYERGKRDAAPSRDTQEADAREWPPRFKFTAEGIAALFLRKHFPTASVDHVTELAGIIKSVAGRIATEPVKGKP